MTAVTGDGDDLPETFAAFALRIGKSRPYVSKLVAEGRISAASLTADRKIVPRLALADIEAAADPARAKASAVPPAAEADGTFAHQRARKTRADADRAELELQARRGELVERATIAATLGPWVRELRDNVLAVPRDTVLDAVQASALEDGINDVFEAFAARLSGLAAGGMNGGAATG
ncbi:terminase small subunit [Falsiroseomonas selenitidurans]|uniref:Terminase small subunit n=1 Tax=Falsiroseomonas selenitidurans TaxID=2716335 RepID=A0ABX1E8H1_9PROT|nr:terminase small subunit [Falsiroseomonas selenitidurans]NKC33489.1 terminase small subunit [Falsiroseomonas selenitidurans]